ncbi:hypothetical protein PISL3812_09798 [Talaromyces islandicus]|uniref:Uncharacterized protein n=1 Tax=Talaromyces islandicus TaxID=28573 RepID=A0A0U1MBN2_TALIS|nr:hypothetical protein PISL3812_09798 [Talaromyces islandicus]
MTLLLDRRDCSQVIKGIIHPAAINSGSEKEIMIFLLDQRKDQIQEDVIMAAAANWYSGKETMTFLLDRRGYQIQITEDVVKAAAANKHSGKDIMILLLGRGDQIRITEDAVTTIIQRLNSTVVRLLLDRREYQIPTTEDIVKAAAGNEHSGEDIMTLLLDRQGD